MRSACLLPVLASILVPSLMGQETSRWTAYAGGGFEAVGVGAPYERAYGLSLQAGYLRQYARVGLRFGVTYFERNRDNPNSFANARAIGATAELSYDLSKARFRPYVIAGWGVYRLSGTRGNWQGPLTVIDQTSLALLGGLGFRYRVGGVNVFSEARLHGFTNGNGWGGAFMPVTVGVRF